MAEPPVSEIEEWRPVPGHPGYEASNLGRVRSIDRWIASSNGARQWQHFYAGRILRSTPNRRYEQVYLGQKHGHQLAHSIICLTFNGKRPSRRHQVGHWNGNPHDNRAANLRWVTPKQNKADEVTHGTRRKGSQHWHTKLTERQIRAVRKMHAETGLTMKAVGTRFGISRFHVWQIVSGNSWKHVL
jgi:hypothetical protein